MRKRETKGETAVTDEEKLLVKRAYDKAAEAEKYWRPTATRFLSPADAALLQKELAFSGIPHFFDGGYDGAERKICLFLPPYMEKEDAFSDENQPLRVLKIGNKAGAVLSHRDYLGALLSLGITREVLGDIVVNGSTAYLICAEDILPYLLLNFEKAGRHPLVLEEVARKEIALPESTGEERMGTVSSLRLDALAALAFRISREEAKRKIDAGLTSVNHLTVEKADTVCAQGDLISVRGHGRARLERIGGESRKGRIFVTFSVQ